MDFVDLRNEGLSHNFLGFFYLEVMSWIIWSNSSRHNLLPIYHSAKICSPLMFLTYSTIFSKIPHVLIKIVKDLYAIVSLTIKGNDFSPYLLKLLWYEPQANW